MTQLNLDAFHADQTRLDDLNPDFEDENESENEDENGRHCPWCYEPESAFREQPPERIGSVACDSCEAVIPVDAEWFKRGEEIVPPPDRDPYAKFRQT